jgi:hypothetical protein
LVSFRTFFGGYSLLQLQLPQRGVKSSSSLVFPLLQSPLRSPLLQQPPTVLFLLLDLRPNFNKIQINNKVNTVNRIVSMF